MIKKYLGITAVSLLLASTVYAAPVKVVSSFTILGDIVKQVGQDNVDVQTIVGPNVDLHHFELTPADMKKLAGGKDAPKALFINGLQLEPWVGRLVKSANFKGDVVVVSKGVEPLKMAHEDHDHDHDAADHDDHDHDHDAADHDDHDHDHDATDHDDHDHDHDVADHDHDHEHEAGHEHHHHHHGIYDPHAWQDPSNVVIYVKNIEQELAKIDPEHAKDYEKNAQAYTDKLNELNASIKKSFDALSPEEKRFGTNHEAFAYYAKAYGLEQVSIGGLGESEPSAKEVAEVMKELKAKNVPAVFFENTKNNKLVEQVAKDTGIRVGGTLIADALTASGDTASYLGMIKANTDTILKALKK